MRVYKVEVTSDMIKRAEEKSKWHGDINNSIRHGEGNVVGYLGEEMALEFLSDVVEENNYDYDMIRFKGTPSQYTIDVKTKERGVSKKGRAYEPRSHYSVHVTTASLHQRVDTYVFAQVNKVESGYEGWILGWMDKDEYLSKAKEVKQGQPDEYGKPETADAFKMEIKDIIHF
jgi:hypothetical protein